MSLYAKYIYEREGVHCHETDELFVTYQINKDQGFIYVNDIFIKEECRSTAKFKEILVHINKVLTKNKIKEVYFKVDLSTNNPEYILKIHLKLGMKLVRCEGDSIIWLKGTQDQVLKRIGSN